jgi:DNA-directed RNA polymerase specialized sigma24 family protein
MHEESDDEVVRLLRLLVKLKVKEIWGDKSLKEAIEALGEMGCSAAEISELMNAPRNTVAPVLSRARKSSKSSKK